MTTNGLIVEPWEAYHAARQTHLTSHALADFRKSPLLYRQKKLGLLPDHDSEAMITGRAVHCLTLEGEDEYKRQFVTGGPVNPKTGLTYGRQTKKFAEWLEEHAEDRCHLSDQQAELVEAVAFSVKAHAEVADALSCGKPELVARTKYCGVDCQIRMDWLVDGNDAILDLKTCEDLDSFEYQANRYGYLYQAAFYQTILANVVGCKLPQMFLVAVEKQAPHRTGMWEVGSDVLRECSFKNKAAIEELEDCAKRNNWPSGYEEIRTIDWME